MNPTFTDLVHAPARSPRRLTRMLLDGGGPLAAPLSAALSSCGHEVESGRLAVDRLDLALRSGEGGHRPDLVVILAEGAVAPTRWGTWRRYGVPHMPVIHDSGRVSVGPVVVPGAPCLRCLDLHRADRDPGWVQTLAQWSTVGATGIVPPEAPLLGAGLALLLIRNLVRERRHLRGVSLEVAPPEPWIVARNWALHPRCGCTEQAGTMGS